MPAVNAIKVVSLEVTGLSTTGASLEVDSGLKGEFSGVKTVVAKNGRSYELVRTRQDLPKPERGAHGAAGNLHVQADHVLRLVPFGFTRAANGMTRFVGIGYGEDGIVHAYTTPPVGRIVMQDGREITGVICAGPSKDDVYKFAAGVFIPGLT